MLNYEDSWGIFVPITLLNNPQPPSRATGGSYLKTFQISILKKKTTRDQWGQKQSKAGGRGKLKAKKREVREFEHSTKAVGKSITKEAKKKGYRKGLNQC